MDCKKALVETGGDLEEAVDFLRKNIPWPQRKSGRVASEGLVGVATKDGIGALVEVNAETDFVARNDDFQVSYRRLPVSCWMASGALKRQSMHLSRARAFGGRAIDTQYRDNR